MRPPGRLLLHDRGRCRCTGRPRLAARPLINRASTSGVTTFANSVRGGGCRSGGACGTGCPSRKSVLDGSEGAALGPASLGACSVTTEDGLLAHLREAQLPTRSATSSD